MTMTITQPTSAPVPLRQRTTYKPTTTPDRPEVEESPGGDGQSDDGTLALAGELRQLATVERQARDRIREAALAALRQRALYD